MNTKSAADLYNSNWFRVITQKCRQARLNDPEGVAADIIARMCEPTAADAGKKYGEYQDYIQRWDGVSSSFANWVLSFVTNHIRHILRRSRSKGGRAIESAAAIVPELPEDNASGLVSEDQMAMTDDSIQALDVATALGNLSAAYSSAVVYTSNGYEVIGRGAGFVACAVSPGMVGKRFERSPRVIAELLMEMDGDSGEVADIIKTTPTFVRKVRREQVDAYLGI